MRVDAYAKVNLSLQVRPPDRSGLHPLRSLAHSIDWADTVELVAAEQDGFEVDGGDDVPVDESNLAMRALAAIRPTRSDPVLLRLTKRIPVAAGLGGGSSDAAAVLAMAARRFGVTEADLPGLGAELGADVPFCLHGGAAWMEGHGERLTSLPPFEDFALAVVVPPIRLSTAAVYRRWDDLGGPDGPGIDRPHLPDSLRDQAPLANDLTPAAFDLAPDLADWAADLGAAWGVPVQMSGSGSALFGFFGTRDEADGAVGLSVGARATRACRPIGYGSRESI